MPLPKANAAGENILVRSKNNFHTSRGYFEDFKKAIIAFENKFQQEEIIEAQYVAPEEPKAKPLGNYTGRIGSANPSGPSLIDKGILDGE
jgi:hypothetical protein